MESALVGQDVTAERENSIATERASVSSTNDSKLHELRKKHAADLVQTRSRHRKDEDEFMMKLTDQSEIENEIDTGLVLESLLSAQEVERSALRSMQTREIAKWKKRGTLALQEFERRIGEEQRSIEDEVDRLDREVLQVKREHFAERKWFGKISKTRITMLEEDEERVILTGSDAYVKL